MPVPGPLELVLILVIVAMLFGVGKLPEVFGSVGKGIREFRKEASVDSDGADDDADATDAAPADTSAPAEPAAEAPVESATNGQSA
jgi:sec-independent protein translocase protein TatA